VAISKESLLRRRGRGCGGLPARNQPSPGPGCGPREGRQASGGWVGVPNQPLAAHGTVLVSPDGRMQRTRPRRMRWHSPRSGPLFRAIARVAPRVLMKPEKNSWASPVTEPCLQTPSLSRRTRLRGEFMSVDRHTTRALAWGQKPGTWLINLAYTGARHDCRIQLRTPAP
jgi:hypothetical protein